MAAKLERTQPCRGGFDLTIKGGAVVAASTYNSPSIGTLVVGSNGWLVLASSQGYSAPALSVSGNATIQAGGGINADGMGNASGTGTGAGRSYMAGTPYGYVGGGGGYGGYGASGGGTTLAYGGITYGSVTAPVDMGSGGGGYTGTQVPPAAGGAGGGPRSSHCNGSFAGGRNALGAGSARDWPERGRRIGGSIYLTVGTLAGSGADLRQRWRGHWLWRRRWRRTYRGHLFRGQRFLRTGVRPRWGRLCLGWRRHDLHQGQQSVHRSGLGGQWRTVWNEYNLDLRWNRRCDGERRRHAFVLVLANVRQPARGLQWLANGSRSSRLWADLHRQRQRQHPGRRRHYR